MNMTVTYEFASLQSLADFYANKARELRSQLTSEKRGNKGLYNAELRGRAVELESIAHTLRNSRIKEAS